MESTVGWGTVRHSLACFAPIFTAYQSERTSVVAQSANPALLACIIPYHSTSLKSADKQAFSGQLIMEGMQSAVANSACHWQICLEKQIQVKLTCSTFCHFEKNIIIIIILLLLLDA